ncbi:hypothetical protein ACIBFB_12210 [Nocardiopsis sp. NPDC050513]|uniref:hypothetical protein n=1 Tax=Nocardiopsis sp. NPDC050513 TaxID=3364338 RepID=UPI00378EB897
MRKRRLEEERRRRLRREATRWALPALLFFLVGVTSGVFAGVWAYENHALDTRGEVGTARALWFLADDQYVWHEQDWVMRADPALSDAVHPYGTTVTVEVVPDLGPLVSVEGARHPAGVAAAVAVASMVIAGLLYLLHLRVSKEHRRHRGWRGVIELAPEVFISDRGMIFSIVALLTFGVLVPIAVVDPVPVDNPRRTLATMLDVWNCQGRGCTREDGEVSYEVRGTEFVREVDNVTSEVGGGVQVLYSHDDPGDVVTVKAVEGDRWFIGLTVAAIPLIGLAFYGAVTHPLRVLWRRPPRRS